MLTPTVTELTRAGRTGVTLSTFPPRRRAAATVHGTGVDAVAWRTSPR